MVGAGVGVLTCRCFSVRAKFLLCTSCQVDVAFYGDAVELRILCCNVVLASPLDS